MMNFKQLKNKAENRLNTQPIENKTIIPHTIHRKHTILRSFQQAMDSADGTEILQTKDGKEWICSVTNMKDDWNTDRKIVCIDNRSCVDVGDILHWEATNTDWLITLQDLTITDYFKGEFWKINYTIKWVDTKGKLREAKVNIKGPAETRTKYDDTRSITLVGKDNDTTEIMISEKDYVDLGRFDRVLIKDRAWRIAVVDDISNRNIVRLNLIEDYTSDIRDDLPNAIPYNNRMETPSKDDKKYYLLGPTDLTALDDEIIIKLMHNGDEVFSEKGEFTLYIDEEEIDSNTTGKFINLSFKEKQKIKIIYKNNDLHIEWNNRVKGLFG